MSVPCCTIGERPQFLAMVNEMLANDMSMRAIEKAAREKKRPVKAETVARHLAKCLGGKRPGSNPVAVMEIAQQRTAPPHSGGPTKAEKDLARLVQKRTIERIEKGEIEPTIKDGLAATALIDKREARDENRKFMLGLARLLSGAGKAGPVGDDPTIIDVTPNPLLAPASARADD